MSSWLGIRGWFLVLGAWCLVLGAWCLVHASDAPNGATTLRLAIAYFPVLKSSCRTEIAVHLVRLTGGAHRKP